jgi:hypothetical protein
MGNLTASGVLDAIIAEHQAHDPEPMRRILEVARRSDDPRLMNICYRAALAAGNQTIITVNDMQDFLASDPGPDYMLHLYRQLLAARML